MNTYCLLFDNRLELYLKVIINNDKIICFSYLFIMEYLLCKLNLQLIMI